MRGTAVIVALLCALRGAPLFAKDQGNIWTFGVTGLRQNLKTGNDNEVIGNSGALQVGHGYVAKYWYLDVSADIIQGPYEPTFQRQLNVEHSGYGLTAWGGVSAQNIDLRSSAGGYGFALGLSYSDTNGKMIGRNRRDSGLNTDADRQLVNDYQIHVSNLSLLPAIFFSWLNAGRPEGNSPDLLMTRIEGYVLLIGAATPLIATYTATVANTNGDVQREHGNLSGYSILVSFQALFGT